MRKLRSDSTTSQVLAFKRANDEPPLHWSEHVQLPPDSAEAEEAKRIFADMLEGRSRSHWKPHHARLLSETSLLTGQISKMTALLLKTGSVTAGKNGHPTRSPVLDALSMLQSLRMQNLKSLGLVGGHAERDNDSKSENNARRLTNNFDDGLLAR